MVAIAGMLSAISAGAQTKPTAHKADSTKAVKTVKTAKVVKNVPKHTAKTDSAKAKH